MEDGRRKCRSACQGSSCQLRSRNSSDIVRTEVEAAGAFANGKQDAFLEDLARRVVRQLDVVDAGHDRGENSVAAILPDDGERRVERCEAADRKTRAESSRDKRKSALTTGREGADERTIQS